jgi:hypothetical protein
MKTDGEQMKSMFDKSITSRYTYGVKKIIAETLVEWDEVKNQRNIEKHGISFETAALVFVRNRARTADAGASRAPRTAGRRAD